MYTKASSFRLWLCPWGILALTFFVKKEDQELLPK
jgi:hypothetical protein